MTTHSPNPSRHPPAAASLEACARATLILGCGVLLSGTLACDDRPSLEGPATAPPPETVECASDLQAPAEARLLTRSEYRRSVQDLLRTDLDPTTSFPPEPVVAGFENDASSHLANPLLVEKHAEAAALLVTNLLERGIDVVFTCEGEGSDCAQAFIKDFGLRAYRRPLTPGEIGSFLSLYERASPSLGHDAALGAIVEVALQSPQFLYRVEAPISEVSETAPNENAVPLQNTVPLGPYEMASRLSYFFWGTGPDDALLDAALEDALKTPEQVEAQARRLLGNERAVERAREFHAQWLGLSRLPSVARDEAPEGAAASWNESTLRFIDNTFWGETPTVRDLFSSSRFYYDDRLAELYEQETPDGWASISQPDERHGLLTQPGLMALFAHADQSSPVQRGVFVRENILCEEVESPPPIIDTNPPDPDPGLTTRERFAVHTENPACANCHRLIDPLGFGLENYDHLGRFRAEENGLDVDASGDIVEVTEDEIEGPFSGPEGMADRIAESETVLSCLARKWFTFAMGRNHNEGDRCSIDQAVAASVSQDGNLQELLIALAASPAFRYRPRHDSDVEVAP